MSESRIMYGMTASTLKKHPALVPLFFFLGVGCVMAGGYVFRLATRCPDVSWNKTKNPYPWQHYDRKQYKFYSENIDYKKLAHPAERPDI